MDGIYGGNLFVDYCEWCYVGLKQRMTTTSIVIFREYKSIILICYDSVLYGSTVQSFVKDLRK